MRIGELSRRTGVSERLLRYYEEQGLLHPYRRPSGYREYDESDIATVSRIRTLLAAGLTTAIIAEVLPCLGEDEKHLAPICSETAEHLHRHRTQIDECIAELQTARRMLDAIITGAAREHAPTTADTTP
ncbi:MerR family transcriptional regulator [Actinobacteria bacterium YIM 96077]|uniref:MerR family transcriptional regulator n=1 Tax=Phytoactinopolyspora halophila TaxID=1981511 RepID=A0A329R224_9ACTN|nr:MerR family transcriptional regulator [Phytoactinopolyspora halophila]AYY12175.1 MerR family transcriptional regulator [Actinobacteria bacterium YIM 96077]RAW18591.1 MerR family transcriptional regulator [Phytoactinopolyspora halophila]